MNPYRPYIVWISFLGPPVLWLLSILSMAYQEYAARRDVLDYLKLAADAPTLSLAQGYLSTAVRDMEARGWTYGNTALIFKVPRRDIGFWYQNTKGALESIESLLAADASLTPVDRSNALVKLRETLMDGNHLTYPDWIELAPLNAVYFWVVLLSMLGSLNSLFVLVRMIAQGRWKVPIRRPAWVQTAMQWIDRQAANLSSTRPPWRRP
jgi:hypothetical protein